MRNICRNGEQGCLSNIILHCALISDFRYFLKRDCTYTSLRVTLHFWFSTEPFLPWKTVCLLVITLQKSFSCFEINQKINDIYHICYQIACSSFDGGSLKSTTVSRPNMATLNILKYQPCHNLFWGLIGTNTKP